MNRISALVLDVDGTIVTCPYDFDAMRLAVAGIASRYGVNVTELGRRGVLEQIEAVSHQLGERGDEFRLQAEGAVEAIEVSAARGASFLPGAAEALRQLHSQGLAIALITRNCRAVSQAVLSGFASYDLLLSRNDVPAVKPDPDHVLRALARVNQPPSRAAMLGDHAFDMQAGRNAKLQVCVGVRTGNSSDESLLAAGAHAVIDSLADLPAWLKGYEEEG